MKSHLMKSQIASFTLCLLLIVITAGCENKQVKQMKGSSTPSIVYPELDTFQNEHLMGLGYAATGAQPNWNEVRRLASADTFKQGIAAFEAAAPPSGVSAEKKQAVVDAAKTLSEADVKAAETAYLALMNAVRAARN